MHEKLLCCRVFVYILLITFSIAMLPAMSLAQTAASGGVGVTLKAGTPGVGADVTVGLHPKFNSRAGFNVFWYGLKESDTDEMGVTVELQADLEWLTVPILLDWHPWESGFRFSLGAMMNKNNIALSADTDSTEINEVDYILRDGVDGEITFNTFSPYLGVGFGNAADTTGNWHFACDLGVMYQGSPQVDLNAVAVNALLQPALDADLESEAKELEDEFKEFTLYPVLSFGVSYTF